MKIYKPELSKLFITLCKISSPSGNEVKIAQYIQKYFNSLEWKVWTDDTGKLNKSNTGNVYAYLKKDSSLDTLLFCAHMDTVQKKDSVVNVAFDGTYFKSDGTTILGADNKAGIATLLYNSKYIDREKLHHNILFFFPTREESGVMGSRFFNFDKSQIKYGFNIDGSGKPGNFVNKSLGYQSFEISLYGKSAHAALEYDKGINALVAATQLINKLPLGKKKTYTLNIGSMICEGSSNVVPDKVLINGELRAFTEAEIKRVFNRMKVICNKIALQTNTKIMLTPSEESFIVPFDQTKNKKLRDICRSASNELGLPVQFLSAYYCSDANCLSAKGIATVNVSRGGENGHSTEEIIQYKDLEKATSLVYSLIHSS